MINQYIHTYIYIYLLIISHGKDQNPELIAGSNLKPQISTLHALSDL